MSRLWDSMLQPARLNLMPEGAHGSAAGLVGPNAVTRMAAALIALDSKAGAMVVFQDAGIERYLETPPTEPVAELDVTRLMQATLDRLGLQRARTVGWIAGHLTAEYLLEHRIPKLAQQLMHIMPARLASHLLCVLMRRHAWTFAGSGQVTFAAGESTRIVIKGCPICSGMATAGPVCTYYAASFEKLFNTLVHTHAKVIETECQGRGDPACVFSVIWR